MTYESAPSRCLGCGRGIVQPERGRRRRYCSRSCQARSYRSRRDAVRTAPPAPAPAPRRRRRPLTAVSIARAAVGLADRLGLDAVSTRRLATELGVATAALYRYYPDRDALLAAMAELVLADVPAPPESSDWRARLRHEARQEWELYRSHPWLLTVLARIRPPVGPALFEILERYLTALDRPGLPPRDLLAGYLAVSGLVQGLALLWSAEAVPRRSAEGRTGSAHADLAELLGPGSSPLMYRLFGGPDPPELDLDEVLDAGLDLLLDGLSSARPET
ncbi:TetR/AcrR family transcriptional regulator [Microlunatus parietis]|uniref:AcrR family transcriptional regulator n=1 Tax=Microlunatus parietis TaxID=682979 RepID=A0A7Y9LC10_9ACTN|nr:TetR/AcrR family transcriptional regulator [Microlunatus parietis]NYE71220.1 AcrR family transcriptional regulator [Microlunatus parietis]